MPTQADTVYPDSHRVCRPFEYGRRGCPGGGPPVGGAAAGVLLRVEQDDVHFGHEEAEEVDRRAQDHAHAETRDLNLK